MRPAAAARCRLGGKDPHLAVVSRSTASLGAAQAPLPLRRNPELSRFKLFKKVTVPAGVAQTKFQV